MIDAPRKKITLSMSEADIALIDEIGKLTGAYTASEVVRDALRQAARIAREAKPSPFV